MARRVLLAVWAAALVLAGAASATLMTTGGSSGVGTGSPSAAPCTPAAAAPLTKAAIQGAAVTTAGSVTTGARLTTTGAGAAQTTTTQTSTIRATTTVSTAPCSTTETTTTGAATGTTAAGTTAAGTTLAGTTASTTTSSAASTLVITGHGWGHGMGMSQWGADGYAHHGWSYTRILSHYYRGTTLGTGTSPIVRVLLVDGKRRVVLRSGSPWQVVDSNGVKLELPAGKLVLPATLLVDGRVLISPLTFTPGKTPVEVWKRPYRGKLIVVSNGITLQVVNALRLDSYVQGVVGAEVPSYWPAAALEAQAVAARSYALAQLETVVTASPFDLYDDTRSQVYGGIDAETPQVTSAVEATAHQVVLYDGKVAMTYFSASSGGRTVSAREGTGKPVPYLVSVPDPYDTFSPMHDWGPVLVGAGTAAKALGLPGGLVGLDTVPGPSDHVATVTALGSEGQVTLSGAQVETALGLRSTWFQVGWLSLTPPSAPVAFGSTVSLTGTARGVSGVSLEVKTPEAGWQPVGTVTPDASGAFSVQVTPDATTLYRLAADTVRAARIRVTVAPVVNASAQAGDVQGTVRPAAAGGAVTVQRQDGHAWTTVTTGTTDSDGAFSVRAQLVPGTYRVRYGPGNGLVPGVSPLLLVSS